MVFPVGGPDDLAEHYCDRFIELDRVEQSIHPESLNRQTNAG